MAPRALAALNGRFAAAGAGLTRTTARAGERTGRIVHRHGALAAALLGIALLGACTPPRERAAPPTAAPMAQPLRVGTCGDYAPFSFVGPDGALTGFDVEVARAYAADRRRALVLVPFRWPELRQRLLAGDFDVAMSGVTVRGDRLVDGIMTDAVARSSAVLVVDATSPLGRRQRARAAAAGTLRVLDRPSVRIAVNRGGHLERVARARLAHARIVPLDDNRLLPCVLADGTADAVVTDTLELASFADTTHCPRAAASGRPPRQRDVRPITVARLSHDRKAYWLLPADGALAADLDAWLREREEDGTLAALRARHFGAAADETEAPASPREDARLLDLVARRLLVMPLVARAKHAASLPIEDRAREEAVESAAASRAAAAGLDPESYRALARAQIRAAKAVQRAADVTPTAASVASAGAPALAAESPTLTDLRAAIDRLDTAILAAAVRAVPLSSPPAAVATRLRDDAELPGLDGHPVGELARALAGLRRAAPVDAARCVEQR